MKLSHFDISFLAILMLGGFHPSLSAAQSDQSKIVSAITERGVSFEENGHIADAIEEFSRALVLDPYNERLHDLILRYQFRAEVTAGQKIKLLHLEDLLKHVQTLKRQINYFADKKQMLLKRLVAKGHNNDRIQREIKEFESPFIRSRKLGNDGISDNQDPLAGVNVFFEKEKEASVFKLSTLQKQYNYLKNLHAKPHSMTETRQKYQSYSEQNTRVSSQRNAVKIPTTQPSSIIEITELKKELGLVRTQLQSLEEKVEEKEQRVNDLTDQVVNISLELSEKDILLNEKNDHLKTVNSEILDLESRFELGQKIIKEKDRRIKELQRNLETNIDTQNSQNTYSVRKDEELIELHGILQIYKGKLSDANKMIKGNRLNIANLQNDLTVAQAKLFQKDTALEKAKQKLVSLESRLDDLQSELLQLKNNRQKSNYDQNPHRKIRELKSQLNIIQNFVFNELYLADELIPELNPDWDSFEAK